MNTVNIKTFDDAAGHYAAQTYWRSDEERALRFFKKGNMLVGGVGGGRVIPHLGRWKVTAVDISPAMVAECAKKGIAAEVMDIQRTTFPDATFDNIFLPFHTICYVDSVEETLKEMRRILRPGGVLVFSAGNQFDAKRLRRGHVSKYEYKRSVHGGMLRIHHFSFFTTCKDFSHVAIYGRTSLQALEHPNWKERLQILVPFIDKSLYFVCS